MLCLLVLIISSAIFPTVSGWGEIGHRIIARLANSQLTDKTTKWVEPLIPWYWNGALSVMASWADDIIHSDSNPAGYRNWHWTRPLHYVNTPDWFCNYSRERDCINEICIDGAIRNYTRRLENEFGLYQREEALYFLIHFVGDIHQPLHTGFKNDAGGNNISVRFMNSYYTSKLHSLWDSGIINHHLRNKFSNNESLYYNHIYRIMLDETSPSDGNDDILQWINENLNFICKDIYFDDQNRTIDTSMVYNLSETYYERVHPIIDKRLALGGRRLAALINRLEPKPAPPKASSGTYVSTYIVIIVLAAEAFVAITMGIDFLI